VVRLQVFRLHEMIWDGIITSTRQATEPETIFVRFVDRNYPIGSKVHFLDIGSGRNANHTVWLIHKRGFNVTAIDSAPSALAHIHQDICSVDSFAPDSFDCCIDINTLCHVEDPPIEKIKTWLKPGGKFFSMAPTNETVRGHLEGKGYCRCATSEQILKLYEPFDHLEIGLSSYPTKAGQIYSWVIEATK